MLLNRSQKIPYVQENKRMLKFKNLIKNTPSKLDRIHQLRTPSNT